MICLKEKPLHIEWGVPLTIYQPTKNIALSERIDRLSKREYLVIALLMLLHFAPFLLLGNDAYIRIHDTLEGEWIWYHLVLNNNATFASQAIIPEMMNGVPRAVFPTGWSMIYFLQSQFGPYWGYYLNYLLIHCIGFFGMFILLRRELIPKADQRLIIGISFIFSLLPAFTTFGLAQQGQPLVLFSFLRVLKGEGKPLHYFILLLFPFYTSIVWGGFPVLVMLGIVAFYFILLKKAPLKPLLLLGIMAGLFGILNLDLIQFGTGDEFVSQRVEYDYNYNKDASLAFSLSQVAQFLTIGHYHSGSFVPIGVLAAIALLALRNKLIVVKWPLLALLTIGFFFGFYNLITLMLGEKIPLVTQFKLDRLVILAPLLWLSVFALSLPYFSRKTAYLLVGCQLFIALIANDEWQQNMRRIFNNPTKPSYQEFFAHHLYQEIDQHIGLPKSDYKLVHLGMHPSVSQFHGFQTIDGHSALYPLAHKTAFRKIINDELDKDDVLFSEFNYWGNRCYIYSAEIGKEWPAFVQKANSSLVNELTIQPQAALALGAKYLLSAVEIKNHQMIGLRRPETFTSPDSFWKLYLYEIES